MKYVKVLLTGLTIVLLLTMTVAPTAFAAKGKGSGGNDSGGNSNPLILWPLPGGGGGGGSGSPSQGSPGPNRGSVIHTPSITQNFQNFVKPQGNVIHTPLVTQNFVAPKNNVVKTPTFTQNFVKGGTLDPKGSNGPTVTQNFLKGGGTLNSKGSNTPSITLNNLLKPGTLDPKGTTVTLNTVKPGTLDSKGTTVTLNSVKPSTLDPKGVTVTTLNNALKTGALATGKTTLTNQRLATTLKTMIGKSATQSQLTALEKALQTKNVKAPVIKDLNLSNADIQLLLNLVSADVAAGDTSAQIITDIATLFNSFGNNNNHNNNNEDENNDDDSDENNENSTTPVYTYPYPYGYIPAYNYSYVPGYNYGYSFVPSSSASAYVDGFGPVALESIQLSNGQTVQIPAPPYNQSMTWGSFGTYANWVAQFQAQNGRAPTDQDTIEFWISQALAGQLRISPTP